MKGIPGFIGIHGQDMLEPGNGTKLATRVTILQVEIVTVSKMSEFLLLFPGYSGSIIPSISSHLLCNYYVINGRRCEIREIETNERNELVGLLRMNGFYVGNW